MRAVFVGRIYSYCWHKIKTAFGVHMRVFLDIFARHGAFTFVFCNANRLFEIVKRFVIISDDFRRPLLLHACCTNEGHINLVNCSPRFDIFVIIATAL